MNPLFSWVGELLPGPFAGKMRYHLQPSLGERWGGAFNGQCFRQFIVANLIKECEPAAIVETGTYHGATTLFLAMNSQVRVLSTEAHPRSFGFASARLRHLQNVTLFCSDSRSFLKGLDIPRDLPVLFYLDAHWKEDLPLHDETEFILGKFSKALILIDDFQVPGDEGYTFDDYGPGKTLSFADFPFHLDKRVSVYLPNCPSSAESGNRRGCVLLASPSLTPRVDRIASLRRHAKSPSS